MRPIRIQKAEKNKTQGTRGWIYLLAFLFPVLISTLMLPNTVIIIPRFMLFKNLGWLTATCRFWYRRCSPSTRFSSL